MSNIKFVRLSLEISPLKNKKSKIFQNKILQKISKEIKNNMQSNIISNREKSNDIINKSKDDSSYSFNKNNDEQNVNKMLNNQKKYINSQNEIKYDTKFLKLLNGQIPKVSLKKQLYNYSHENKIIKLSKSLSSANKKIFRSFKKKYLENQQQVNKLLLPKLDNMNSFDSIFKNLNSYEDSYNIDNFNKDMSNFDQQYETIRYPNQTSKIIVQLTRNFGRKKFLKKCKVKNQVSDNDINYKYIMKFPRNLKTSKSNSQFKSFNNNNSKKICFLSLLKENSENKYFDRIQKGREKKESEKIALSRSNSESYNKILKKINNENVKKIKFISFNSLREQINNGTNEIREINKKIKKDLNIENIILSRNKDK